MKTKWGTGAALAVLACLAVGFFSGERGASELTAGTGVMSTSKASAATSQPASSTEVDPSAGKTPVQVLTDDTVRQLFQESLGSIQGNHALYYRELAQGTASPSPLIIQNQPIRAASVIKVFILAALYHQVEAGVLRLDEEHRLTDAEKVGGTGSLQVQAAGTSWSLAQLADLMIAESDNTASNILIDRLGGVEATQALIESLGYTKTRLNRKFLDVAALNRGVDNYITAQETGDLLGKIYQGELFSEETSRQILTHFHGQHYRDKLLAQLPSNIVTYNKTGMYEDYGVQSDAAIIVTEKGAFVVVVLSDSGVSQEQNQMLSQFGRDLTTRFIEHAD